MYNFHHIIHKFSRTLNRNFGKKYVMTPALLCYYYRMCYIKNENLISRRFSHFVPIWKENKYSDKRQKKISFFNVESHGVKNTCLRIILHCSRIVRGKISSDSLLSATQISDINTGYFFKWFFLLLLVWFLWIHWIFPYKKTCE